MKIHLCVAGDQRQKKSSNRFSVCMINALALIYNHYNYYLLLNWIMSSDFRNCVIYLTEPVMDGEKMLTLFVWVSAIELGGGKTAYMTGQQL